MDDALAVRSIEGVRDLHGVLEPQIQWQGTFLKSVRECLAIQVLHHQEIGAVFVTDVVERTDVRMVEGGNRPRLAFKPFPEVRVRRDIRRQDFDRDAAIQACVARFVDFAHAARTDERDDFVRAETSAGSKGHRRSR